jgi:DNA-binding beta-propeller fold protein YncE
MPLNMLLSPERDRVVVLLNGWREQGLQIFDRATGRVVQEVPQPAAFLGMAFAPDGRALYVSGGNQDVVYRYAWRDRSATLVDSIVLATKHPDRPGTSYPAGLAVSSDGLALYVAENLADSLAVVDLETGRVVQRFATERYPYGVAVAPDGGVYVSAWGGWTVSAFARGEGAARLSPRGRWRVARHPSALVLNSDGSRLFVASGSTDRIAVVDTRTGRVVKELLDHPPAGPHEGSTPNALALSADGARLFAAEADNNAVAMFDLAAATSGVATAAGSDTLAGRVPAGWYPTAVIAAGDTLLTLNGKGRGTGPNVDYPQPGAGTNLSRPRSYTLGQLSGTLTVSATAHARGATLARLSERVERANGWRDVRRGGAYPPIEHVLYIIKENRTYDQVLADMPQGDGDTTLLFFPRQVSPNHHALAERFGLYDRFFVNAEVSPDGHNWSMAAYVTDYAEKTIPSNYSSRGRTYDYEGTNRGRVPSEEGEDDAAEPANGYLWDLAQRAGLTLRNYGEFVVPDGVRPSDRMPAGYKGIKPFLAANTNRDFPPYDLDIPDQKRADVFLAELAQYVQRGELPRLMIMRLPNDHTAGGSAGAPTPLAYMADNDLALGRVVEALSKTPFWRSTAVFVLEDDAQSGPDHVDSHRSVLLVISPWARGGVHHRFTNTTDVVATMEEILGLDALSKFDYYGRPLRDIWTTTPDLRPYAALTPSVPLTQRNPQSGADARDSRRLALDFEDIAEEDLFNRILWRMLKGTEATCPGVTRMSALEFKRGR